MTSHIPGYSPGRPADDGLDRVRSDVHVHAGLATVHAALSDPARFRVWLPAQLTSFHGDSEGFSCRLDLPGRSESLRLRRSDSSPGAVTYVRDGASHVESFSWAVHVEGRTEVHVTAELAYRPTRGLVRTALETLLYRPHRTQALRDLLWNMKRQIETTARGDAEEAAGS